MDTAQAVSRSSYGRNLPKLASGYPRFLLCLGVSMGQGRAECKTKRAP
jgi:hypothetical protein